ncbi:MAG: type II secretion system protein [Candidatus Omnitrophica bacterium]|nr:type II secretion system protein [Candidatus Omnitrophota bacterium]
MKKNRGFTLVEIAASLMILGVAFVSILGMFYIGSRAGRLSEERTIAYNLLERKMEGTISKSFNAISDSLDETYDDFPGYTLDTTVNNVSPTLKEITVAIRWQGAAGIGHESITTKVCNVKRAAATKTSGKKEKWSWGSRHSK